MSKMTYQFYMGLTIMADMNCFAAADFLNSSSDSAGGSSAKNTKRGQFIKSSGRENMNENTKRFSVSWKETSPHGKFVLCCL